MNRISYCSNKLPKRFTYVLEKYAVFILSNTNAYYGNVMILEGAVISMKFTTNSPDVEQLSLIFNSDSDDLKHSPGMAIR